MNRFTPHFWMILRTVLGIGLLYYVLSTAGIWSSISRLISILWLLPSLVVLTLFGATVEAKRLGYLFRSQGIYLPFRKGYRLVTVGTFFNFCIPGGTGGDVMKLYYLTLENPGRGIEVATVLFIDRAVALFSLLFLIVGLALLNRQFVKDYLLIQWLVIAAGIGMIGILVGIILSCSLCTRISKLSYPLLTQIRIPFFRYFGRAFKVLLAFRDYKGVLLGAAFISLCGHLALTGMFLLVGREFFPQASGLTVGLLALLGMLVNALPITPGGLGVGEAAFNGLFGLLGYVGGAQLMLAWRLGTIPLCLIGCGLYIWGVQKEDYLIQQARQIFLFRPSPEEVKSE
jgi:uncharacterized protein (TIRG00374 family)